MPLILYCQSQILGNMQYNKKCKKCKKHCVHIGSAQNGFIWYCRKCNYVDYATSNPNQF